MRRVLVADDDRTVRRNLLRLLESEGYTTLEAADGREALDRILADDPDAVLLDLRMPGLDGLEVLEAISPRLAVLPVIVLTAYGGSDPAIEAMRRGAYDYLTKPFDLDEILLTLQRALHQRELAAAVQTLRQSAGRLADDDEDDLETRQSAASKLVGRSPAMRDVYKAIGRAAATDEPILITGESGTGKELVAEALHRHSRRADGPFLRVNCAALPESLIESELFGHERGAFTGADRQRPGRFERAAGGSIFLDEVAELPLAAQARLLRVLQSHEFERVGGAEVLRSDARVISATHRDLARQVAAGRFREDLYYRLNVIPIAIPPLRRRRDDIVPLIDHILRRLEAKYGWSSLAIDAAARADLVARDWPGNVRQLENVLARAAVVARGRPILPEHLERETPAAAASPTAMAAAEAATNDILPLRAVLAGVEERVIRHALIACGHNRTRAAERLGISRRHLFDKIREYDIEVP